MNAQFIRAFGGPPPPPLAIAERRFSPSASVNATSRVLLFCPPCFEREQLATLCTSEHPVFASVRGSAPCVSRTSRFPRRGSSLESGRYRACLV